MTERDEGRAARRLEETLCRLQHGRRAGIEPEDAPDEVAIRTASRLAGAREPYPRLDPEFRRALAARLGSSRKPTLPSRRWALAAAAGLLGGAALGIAADRQVVEHEPAATQGRLTPDRAGAIWVDTALKLDDLSEGLPVPVTAGGLPLFLIRQGYEVRAFSNICSHQPCQLVWDAAEGRIRCPWGNYQRFSLDGSSNHSGIPPLPAARVRIAEGRIEVYGVR
ncbi:MAG: Rieske (2Fe-2S) protein [Candidatus Dormibacteraceae bacterium]